MIVKSFYLNSQQEIIVKIVKEILVLFKVTIDENAIIYDYDELKIINTTDNVESNGVKTTLVLRKADNLYTYEQQSHLHVDESIKAGTNRLIKLNLYHIFVKNCKQM